MERRKIDKKAVIHNVKELLKSAGILCGLIIVGTVLMILVYALPTGKVFMHVKENATELYSSNSNGFQWAPGISSSSTSYGTDAIMLNNAIYHGASKDIVLNAMLNPRFENGKGDPINSLFQAVQYESLESIHPTRAVFSPPTSCIDNNNTNSELETMYYPNYWHGYLLFLKPLLFFFNVSEIRMINMLVQIMLTSIVVYLFSKKMDTGIALAFLTTVIILNPVTLILTFQETDIFLITLCSLIVILLFNNALNRNDRYIYFFLFVGALTSFVDFLTYPLVSLGIPLSTFILLNYFGAKQNLLKIVKYSFFWAFGYVGLWFGKFAMCAILTNYNAVERGVQQILFRLGSDASNITGFDTTPVEALVKNIKVLCTWSTLALICIMIIIIACFHLRGLKHVLSLGKRGGLFLIAFFPIAWYLVVANHSAIHPPITYRELAISWFCISSMALFSWQKA